MDKMIQIRTCGIGMICQQTGPSTPKPDDPDPFIDGAAYQCLDAGVESGNVSSTGQNGDDRFFSGMVFHNATSLTLSNGKNINETSIRVRNALHGVKTIHDKPATAKAYILC
jgi:hypothetical protein